MLKADQLSENGRIGKIPLRKLLTKYCSHISRSGEVNWDLDRQLLNEHGLKQTEVDTFASASKELRTDLKKCGKDKECKDNLIAAIKTKIENFCVQVDKGELRTVVNLVTHLKSIPVLPAEDPELKRQDEITSKIRALDKKMSMHYCADWSGINAEKRQLASDYSLTIDQVERLLSDVRWKRRFPNAK